MADYKGIEYLRRKLILKQPRIETRYEYYEMKNVVKDLGISTPPKLRNQMSVLGWCGKAVDSIADRLDFREFADDNFDLQNIYEMNNADVLVDSAILGALIASCNFIYIAPDNDGFPQMQVVQGKYATGIMDPTTGMLTEGYAILERDDYDRPVVEAWMTADVTTIYRQGKVAESYPNPAPYPLLVPIVYRPDAVRMFGHSRISRACMSIVDSAVRTMKRSEISAEFFSFPQRYATGVDPDAEKMEKWQAAMSSFLTFTVNEDGQDHVKLGQFAQQSMQPHVDQLKMFASAFAGETGLTLDDLGFATDNPTSAEAIKASHENLRLSARKAQKNFGIGLLNAGYLAACVRDNFEYQRRAIYLTKPKWNPIFESDVSALGGVGDAVMKLQQGFPEYFDEEKLKDLTGI